MPPPRVVRPEILDELPAGDPEARRSRRDLALINWLMGNERWIMRQCRRFAGAAGPGVVEIGAGDGRLAGKLAQALPGHRVSGYDLMPRPASLPESVEWRQGDLFDASPAGEAGILVANLFLHHFEAAQLRRLGEWMAGFHVLVINEPDRVRHAHLLGGLLWPVVNRVTDHDLHVSIDAGFAGEELPSFLGLQDSWSVRETSSWRGSRRVVAWRV